MKRFIAFFKSKKQEKPSIESSHQLLCDAFGRMLDCTRKSRQIDNDIWYS
jgi:hypothetical protein